MLQCGKAPFLHWLRNAPDVRKLTARDAPNELTQREVWAWAGEHVSRLDEAQGDKVGIGLLFSSDPRMKRGSHAGILK
jgi:hypothetical protein